MTHKKVAKNSMYVGQLVVTSEMLYGQVYTIGHIFKGTNMIELQHREGERLCSQVTDYSLCMHPTVKQIEHSINDNGPLVGVNDLAFNY